MLVNVLALDAIAPCTQVDRQAMPTMEILTLNQKPASILGLAANQTMDRSCVNRAFAAGINYFFFYDLSFTNLLDGLKPLLTHNREAVMVATGSQNRSKSELIEYLDRVRCYLNIDVVDVFFIEYVSPADEMSQVQQILDELYAWKEKGSIRYVGVTVHNRPLALKLIEDKRCEVLMHRYNMAHRGAEKKVLPAALEAGIPVIAFTCTRWGSLLKGHPNWQAPVPQAADCYRYALQHPAVRLALTAPQNMTQLEENLCLLQTPSLSSQEVTLWQQYGDLIYDKGKDAFETQWP